MLGRLAFGTNGLVPFMFPQRLNVLEVPLAVAADERIDGHRRKVDTEAP
jgi:hypothetical protein